MSLPSTLRTDFRHDIGLIDSAFVRFWAVTGLVLALLLPLLLTNFWTSVANQVFIAVIGALALNLLMGRRGRSRSAMPGSWRPARSRSRP